MKVSQWFFVAAIVSLSSPLFAISSPDDGPLYPGSILIAGDLSRNEFYILGRDEAKPEKPAVMKMASTKMKSERNVKLASALKTVLPTNQKKQLAASSSNMMAGKTKSKKHQDLVPKIDTALHQASHQAASHKILSRVKSQGLAKRLASKVEPARAVKKIHEPLRIKVALHTIKIQKLQRKKIHSELVAVSKTKIFKPVFKEYKDIVNTAKIVKVTKKANKVKIAAKGRSKFLHRVAT